MAKLIVLVVLVIGSSLGASGRTTPKYVSYNSSDLSYLSNGIQFPVPANENADPIFQELVDEDLPEMEWMARLYNHHKWDQHLKVLSNNRCFSDMTTYLGALYNGTSWAAKMHDASGRYSGQFFFGNDFWLGSKTLCWELTNSETNGEIPPYPVHYLVAKIRINLHQLTPVTRQLNVGQCLPKSCTTTDVRLLLIQERSQEATINIVGVRVVPGDYELWKDIKFHIVGGTALIVFVLICVATLLEILSKQKSGKVDAEIQNNNNNNNNVEDGKPRGFDLTKDLHVNEAKPPQQGKFLKVLLTFSALNNGKKILRVDTISKDSIRCIHGLRFFSIIWIILVHTYLEVFSIADNKTLRTITERSFMYQTISNATFSVDTFFFISGLLVTITYFRTSAKSSERFKQESTSTAIVSSIGKFLYFIVYRFFRLTPAYLFVLGVNEIILRYLHSTSVFSPAIIDHVTCERYWWRNALYINNLFPQNEFCMLWSWYISNDTQFYVLAVIFLLIAVRGDRHLKFAGAGIVVFLFTSWITTFIIAMKYNYVARVEEPFALFDQLYDKPWLRIGPYLVGMVAGCYLHKINCHVRMGFFTVFTGWTLSLACLASLVYGLGREGLVVPASAFYAALGHTAWGLSLAWITVACCSGYGGPFDQFFSFKGFVPLSRLTYCAYLIHPVLMCLTSFILDGPIHMHQAMVLILYCGNAVVSFLCAFLISLAFEAPVVNLLKIVFSQSSKDI